MLFIAESEQVKISDKISQNQGAVLMGISSSILKLISRVSKREKEKKRLMFRNGGMLLEELLHSCDGKYNPFRIFSAKEIAIATNNYDELLQEDYWLKMYKHCWPNFSVKVIARAIPFKMYKGSFNGRQICVKSFNSDYGVDGIGANRAIGYAINEIVFASQVNNHNHILMLLGCCLETEAPLLVYEYAENGALSDHIFKSESNNHHHQQQQQQQQQQQLLPWDYRLKVAKEIADALAYLHTGLSMPIIHRNVETSNIYLNGNYDAKLSDFSLSVSIPPGEEYVETNEIRGTRGHIAPEHSQTGQLTEKSDVYSFGLMMFEMLSGERISTLLFKESIFASSVSGSDLVEMVERRDPDWVAETNIGPNNKPENVRKQVTASTELALKCTKESPEERPTMKEAAQELRRIIKWQ